MPPKFVCIGAPYFIGARLPERTEVAAIRDSGIVDEIGATWVDFVPDFSAAPDSIMTDRVTADRVTAVNRALAQIVAQYRHHIPLIFASDCVSGLGAVKGLGRNAGRDIGVIWYDAHGDFNTPETSPSGFLGGMPLAMLVGRGDLSIMQTLDLEPLNERDVLITDARDLDPAEGEALRASAITHLPDVSDLLTVDLPNQPLYVHLDTDVVTPDDMPGMAYGAAGGPTLETVAATVERVARDGQIAGVLFSLWNASLAPNDPRPLDGTLRLVRAVVAGLAG